MSAGKRRGARKERAFLLTSTSGVAALTLFLFIPAGCPPRKEPVVNADEQAVRELVQSWLRASAVVSHRARP